MHQTVKSAVPDRVADATELARWLLAKGIDGIALTQTHALAQAVVREAAERWPDWWNAELFGPPHREAELRVLETLHDGLRRLRLMRRRGRALYTTARGRELIEDPEGLLSTLAADLGASDPLVEAVAATITNRLVQSADASHDELDAHALERVPGKGWRPADGRPATGWDLSPFVFEVLVRGEAYGLIECQSAAVRTAPRFSLTDAGRSHFGRGSRRPVDEEVFVFDAELVNAMGVRTRLAVAAEQPLTALHDAIQEAFGWLDDHLYAFWLDGQFWGDESSEFTTPDTPDEGVRTADASLVELGLRPGMRIAYVFDFGDEWRVHLTVRECTDPDGGTYPRVLERKGEPPPQYSHFNEG